MRWDLSKLYSSFEDEALQRDFKRVEDYIGIMKEWAGGNLDSATEPVRKIEEYINMEIDITNHVIKLLVFSHLNLSVNAKNDKAAGSLGKIQERVSEFTKWQVLFQKWLSKIENLEAVIISSRLLQEHGFYLKELVSKSKTLLSDQEEYIIAKMSNTGGKAWSKLQQVLTATLLVDININGEEKSLPLPEVRNMAFHKSPEVRRLAYEAELKAYEKIAESSAACLNGIKGETITIGKLRGAGSPLEETLVNSRMKRETLEAMLTAMVESLPSFHRFFKRKAELLGHAYGLPFYDLFAPMGESNLTFTLEEARDYIIGNFNNFNPELGQYVKRAFDNNWIDSEVYPGKSGGAFCSNIHPIKESRILVNFDGSFKNVTTLAHELGHGYHGQCLIEESILNSTYPMPLAETASIFAETILVKDALERASKEDSFAILENEITQAAQVIVDIYSRYLFETAVFDRRIDHNLSVKELNEIMLEAQKTAYGNGLDHNFLHEYMWVNKVHYYYPTRHFYNFPYAFGLLFSKGLYSLYLKNRSGFPQRYKELLAATGKMSIEDVAKIMDIDVTDISFWRSSLKLVAEDIELFIKLSEAK